MNNNHKLTETDINNIDVKRQLEHQIQIEETKESDWIFAKFNSMQTSFYKTGELIGSKYVIFLLRSDAILNIENDAEYCFIWSILARLHRFENDHSNKVSNCRQFFNELKFEGFDFSRGFRCSDGHIFEKLSSLSIKVFELKFCQDQNKGKHNLIPIKISKND